MVLELVLDPPFFRLRFELERQRMGVLLTHFGFECLSILRRERQLSEQLNVVLWNVPAVVGADDRTWRDAGGFL